MSRADLHDDMSQCADVSSTVPALYQPLQVRDPGCPIGAGNGATITPPGQPGHGTTASLRRQPVRIVEGRAEGGYTDLFEIICYDCGDHRYLDYSQIPPRLQRIRGPYPMEAALAAYEQHLGLRTLRRPPH
jgi:hypothetical protein